MKIIAVPLANRRFCSHFGGAEEFALFSVDETSGAVTEAAVEPAPAHERGAFPEWLRGRCVNAVLASGMGGRAAQMFDSFGIEVVTGVREGEPLDLVERYLAGTLNATAVVCGGGKLHDCGHHGHGPEARRDP